MIQILKSLYRIVRGFFRHYGLKLSAHIYDQYHHVDTQGVLCSKLHSIEYVGYEPSDTVSLKKILHNFKLRAQYSKDVFIDFGCGKGRVLLIAGAFPFKKVIGVEVDKALWLKAQQNIDRFFPRSSLKASSFQVLGQEVTELNLPDDVTVLYFFNPFLGSIFQKVMDKIALSLKKNPRQITIIYRNAKEHHRVLSIPGMKEIPVHPSKYSYWYKMYQN